jgi:hypothetical protein
MSAARLFRCGLIVPLLPIAAADPVDEARKEIVAAYRRSLDALRRGDADGALAIETPDWIGITAGQKPRTRLEMEPFIRRDIASMKPPVGWVAVWKPDYEHNGTGTGIQIYDVELSGSEAIVSCLVGSTRSQMLDGSSHNVWTGSHVRDTWIRNPDSKNSDRWKRRLHEKLTVNERMVDGQPASAR